MHHSFVGTVPPLPLQKEVFPLQHHRTVLHENSHSLTLAEVGQPAPAGDLPPPATGYFAAHQIYSNRHVHILIIGFLFKGVAYDSNTNLIMLLFRVTLDIAFRLLRSMEPLHKVTPSLK